MPETREDLTRLLDAWSNGHDQALEELLPLVVDDLRRMARARLARESPGHTLEPTALVNELYLRLIGKRSVSWQGRSQFFATMAQLMRRILVDHARRRQALKKGGAAVRVTFDKALDVPDREADLQEADLLLLDDAVERLAEVDPRAARIVELRYFAGLTLKETAQTLDVSTMTIKREWRVAKMWLRRALTGAQNDAQGAS